MLSFEPHPFSYFVLTHRHRLGYFIECVEGCFLVLFDKVVSFFYGFAIHDTRQFFHHAWLIS